MQRLTDVNYWEETWWSAERPRRLWLYRDFDFETVRLLKGIAGGEAARVLEVGGGGSRVLPYLRRRFGYEVFGSDFSFKGCRLLRANLALQGVDGGVICEDLFRSSLRSDWFDVVYSVGLIEHFDDTRPVIIEHLRVLRPGGHLVLIVPNLEGVQGRILRRLAPDLVGRHRVFGPQDLEGILKSLGLKSVTCGYLGSFFIHIGRDTQWTKVRRWPVFLQLLIPGSVRLMNGVISFLFRLSPLRPRSRSLSPAFYAVGTKPGV
jgi:SAM-dependent methyltransferase